MAVTYHSILGEVGLRVGALKGAQPAQLEATRAKTTLQASDFQSAVFPYTSIKNALLMAEEEIIQTIGATGGHPFREYLISHTAPLQSRTTLPRLGANRNASVKKNA